MECRRNAIFYNAISRLALLKSLQLSDTDLVKLLTLVQWSLRCIL